MGEDGCWRKEDQQVRCNLRILVVERGLENSVQVQFLPRSEASARRQNAANFTCWPSRSSLFEKTSSHSTTHSHPSTTRNPLRLLHSLVTSLQIGSCSPCTQSGSCAAVAVAP